MPDYRDQRYAIKFCVLMKKIAVETYDELKKGFDDETMTERTCFCWHPMFLKGRESCELQGGKGAPVTALTEVNIYTGAAVIRTDPSPNCSRTRPNVRHIYRKHAYPTKGSSAHVSRARTLDSSPTDSRNCGSPTLRNRAMRGGKTLLWPIKAGFIVTTLK